jgi:hypothetical protein
MGVVRFTLQTALPPGKSPTVHTGLGGHQSRCGRHGEEKKFTGFELRILGRQAMKLTNHIHIMPRSGTVELYLLCSSYILMA